METLKRQHQRLLKYTSTNYVRDVYNSISWNARLVGIKGARGVGKTTLMLQRIKLAFADPTKALYVSLDDVWFGSHSLIDLAQMAADEGVTHLFVDEVHRLPGWQQQIKNIYDLYPDVSVVFTSSSLLNIDNSVADLSRRCLMYDMAGLSFREYLIFEGIAAEKVQLADILYSHQELAASLLVKTNVLAHFARYLRRGFYPFYLNETEADYLVRVKNMVSTVIDLDIPAVDPVEYSTLLKTKQLISVIASQSPSTLNLKQTADLMETTSNQLIKILSYLERSHLLRLLYYKGQKSPRSMAKPRKVLFDNPSIIHALGRADIGKIRETFFASMLAHDHEISYPDKGDLLVDGRYLFEVGGSRKSFDQIRDIPDSFIAADGLDIGLGNKIPLWLFGLLY